MLALEKGGADVIELGIPFSDPQADGPAIQHANNVSTECRLISSYRQLRVWSRVGAGRSSLVGHFAEPTADLSVSLVALDCARERHELQDRARPGQGGPFTRSQGPCRPHGLVIAFLTRPASMDALDRECASSPYSAVPSPLSPHRILQPHPLIHRGARRPARSRGWSERIYHR